MEPVMWSDGPCMCAHCPNCHKSRSFLAMYKHVREKHSRQVEKFARRRYMRTVRGLHCGRAETLFVRQETGAKAHQVLVETRTKTDKKFSRFVAKSFKVLLNLPEKYLFILSILFLKSPNDVANARLTPKTPRTPSCVVTSKTSKTSHQHI